MQNHISHSRSQLAAEAIDSILINLDELGVESLLSIILEYLPRPLAKETLNTLARTQNPAQADRLLEEIISLALLQQPKNI